jgi:hypothetical protein
MITFPPATVDHAGRRGDAAWLYPAPGVPGVTRSHSHASAFDGASQKSRATAAAARRNVTAKQ